VACSHLQAKRQYGARAAQPATRREPPLRWSVSVRGAVASRSAPSGRCCCQAGPVRWSASGLTLPLNRIGDKGRGPQPMGPPWIPPGCACAPRVRSPVAAGQHLCSRSKTNVGVPGARYAANSLYPGRYHVDRPPFHLRRAENVTCVVLATLISCHASACRCPAHSHHRKKPRQARHHARQGPPRARAGAYVRACPSRTRSCPGA
jgi:hypothetical protein